MEKKPHEKPIQSKVTITKLPSDKEVEHILDKSVDWVQEILMELNKGAEFIPSERLLSSSHLDINLKLKRNFNREIGDYLLMKVDLNTEYHTECVRTLMPMKDTLSLKFQACFIDRCFEKDEKYVELTDIFMETDVYELLFHDKRQADLKEAINEQIYLNINPYPVLNPDSEFIMPPTKKQ